MSISKPGFADETRTGSLINVFIPEKSDIAYIVVSPESIEYGHLIAGLEILSDLVTIVNAGDGLLEIEDIGVDVQVVQGQIGYYMSPIRRIR